MWWDGWERVWGFWQPVRICRTNIWRNICWHLSSDIQHTSWELWNFNPPKSSHVSLLFRHFLLPLHLHTTMEKISFHQNIQLNVLNQQSAWGYVICATNRKNKVSKRVNIESFNFKCTHIFFTEILRLHSSIWTMFSSQLNTNGSRQNEFNLLHSRTHYRLPARSLSLIYASPVSRVYTHSMQKRQASAIE